MTNRERESPVSEFDGLVETALWLLDQRCSEITVSIAHGQGRPLQPQKKELEEILAEKGVAKISFVSHGPDLEAHDNARFEHEIPTFECADEMISIALSNRDQDINILSGPGRSPHSKRQSTQKTIWKLEAAECRD